MVSNAYAEPKILFANLIAFISHPHALRHLALPSTRTIMAAGTRAPCTKFKEGEQMLIVNSP